MKPLSHGHTGVLHPKPGPHPIHTFHRLSMGAIGCFLLTFGTVGLTRGLNFLSPHGEMVMGLSTNGLLATVSVAVAAVLLAAAAKGGPTASGVGIVLGVLFVISGFGNLLVTGTSMNMLAFGLSNVIFSLAVGLVLLFTGAYGRIATQLPPDNPYFQASRDRPYPAPPPDLRTAAERLADEAADRELAEAERAHAQGHASTAQAQGVAAARRFRSPEDRRRAWRQTQAPHTQRLEGRPSAG